MVFVFVKKHRGREGEKERERGWEEERERSLV